MQQVKGGTRKNLVTTQGSESSDIGLKMVLWNQEKGFIEEATWLRVITSFERLEQWEMKKKGIADGARRALSVGKGLEWEGEERCEVKS
jgi:hypothetical protein